MVTINQMVKDSIKARKSQKELHHSLMLKAWMVGKKVNSIWHRTGKIVLLDLHKQLQHLPQLEGWLAVEEEMSCCCSSSSHLGHPSLNTQY